MSFWKCVFTDMWKFILTPRNPWVL